MRPVEPPDTSRGAHLAGPPGPTMLIVEDESSIARALARLLAHEGYQVELVANGQEALGPASAESTPAFYVICECRR